MIKKKVRANGIIYVGIIITMLLTIANIYRYKTLTHAAPFEEFILKNTGKHLLTPCEYNFFVIISPIDCQSCSEYFRSLEFVRTLQDNNGYGKECLNYVITGDYTEKEKLEYVSDIKDYVNTYIDNRNKAKMYLLEKYDTPRTPFLIVLTKKKEVKYFHEFMPDAIYDASFLRLLEFIL